MGIAAPTAEIITNVTSVEGEASAYRACEIDVSFLIGKAQLGHSAVSASINKFLYILYFGFRSTCPL